MSYLNANTLIVSYLPLVIALLGLLCLCLVVFLSLLRAMRNTLVARDAKKWDEVYPEILEEIRGEGTTFDLGKLLNSKFHREQLLSLVGSLNGYQQKRLQSIYIQCGFAHQDYQGLQSQIPRRKSAALRRLRSLEIPLPDVAWRTLIRDVSPIFRWGVMEHILSVKKTKALPWLFAFIFQPNNYNRRVMMYFFSILASYDRSVLVLILRSCDDQTAIEASMRVLAAYPSDSALDEIIAQLSPDWNHEITIAALRALLPYQEQRAKEVFLKYICYEHWVARMLCARGLKGFPSNDAAEALKQLLIDESYYVRREAFTALVATKEHIPDVLDEVYDNQHHPAYELLSDSKEWLERTAS